MSVSKRRVLVIYLKQTGNSDIKIDCETVACRNYVNITIFINTVFDNVCRFCFSIHRYSPEKCHTSHADIRLDMSRMN